MYKLKVKFRKENIKRIEKINPRYVDISETIKNSGGFIANFDNRKLLYKFLCHLFLNVSYLPFNYWDRALIIRNSQIKKKTKINEIITKNINFVGKDLTTTNKGGIKVVSYAANEFTVSPSMVSLFALLLKYHKYFEECNNINDVISHLLEIEEESDFEILYSAFYLYLLDINMVEPFYTMKESSSDSCATFAQSIMLKNLPISDFSTFLEMYDVRNHYRFSYDRIWSIYSGMERIYLLPEKYYRV